MHAWALRRSRSVSRPYKDSFDSSIRPIIVVASQVLRRFRVPDNNFLSLVASLPSWRCLALSTSSFLHAAINFRHPSVTVSTHTSASNAAAFQSPAMSKNLMLLCMQSVHSYFSFPPHPLRIAPSRLPNTIRFGKRPPLIVSKR